MIEDFTTLLSSYFKSSYWIEQITYQENAPLLFSSFFFLILFSFFYGFYLTLTKNIALRTWYVIIFSFYFYYKSSGLYVGILLFSSIVDYYLGTLIFNTEMKSKKKFYLFISVCINLGMLAYFKYTHFLFDNLNLILENNFAFDQIFLPIGISFFHISNDELFYRFVSRKYETCEKF